MTYSLIVIIFALSCDIKSVGGHGLLRHIRQPPDRALHLHADRLADVPHVVVRHNHHASPLYVVSSNAQIIHHKQPRATQSIH